MNIERFKSYSIDAAHEIFRVKELLLDIEYIFSLKLTDHCNPRVAQTLRGQLEQVKAWAEKLDCPVTSRAAANAHRT